MAVVSDIFQALLDFNEPGMAALVLAELDAGADIKEVLNKGLIGAMDEVGRRFSDGRLFVPAMLMAAQAKKAGFKVIKPLLADGDSQGSGTVVIGTVKGGLHDIGKNLVSMMIEGAGFNVLDLGADVNTDAFVAAAKGNRADIVALSALLATTIPSMEQTVRAFKEQGDGVRTNHHRGRADSPGFCRQDRLGRLRRGCPLGRGTGPATGRLTGQPGLGGLP